MRKHFGENWFSDDEFDRAGGNNFEADGAGTGDDETILSVLHNYDGQQRNGGKGKTDEKDTKGPRNTRKTGRGLQLNVSHILFQCYSIGLFEHSHLELHNSVSGRHHRLLSPPLAYALAYSFLLANPVLTV